MLSALEKIKTVGNPNNESPKESFGKSEETERKLNIFLKGDKSTKA